MNLKEKLAFPSKVAVIAPDDLSFGLSRVYEVYREKDEIELKVFRTEQKGIEWLKTFL